LMANSSLFYNISHFYWYLDTLPLNLISLTYKDEELVWFGKNFKRQKKLA
jgi:hypothetical protein